MPNFARYEDLIFLIDYTGYLWLIVGIFLLLAELGTPGLFFFVAFAIGCFVAAPLAFLGYPFAMQCLAALAASLTSFFGLKYFFAAKLRGEKGHKTNIEALVGQRATVVKTIERGRSGYVRIGGEEWQARMKDGTTLHKGSVVCIIGVRGNSVIVGRVS